jgi:hypothetical protein
MTAISTDTAEGWLNHWLTHIAVRCVRPRTLESYESMIRMHITPYLAGQRLDRLQPEHLEHLYNALLEKDQSPTSVLRVHRTIFRALKVAMQRQRIHRNGATLVDPPAQRSKRGRDRPHARRGHRRSGHGARPAQRGAVDRRPRPRATAIRSARAAVEGHRRRCAPRWTSTAT